jgi:hypothetical protein
MWAQQNTSADGEIGSLVLVYVKSKSVALIFMKIDSSHKSIKLADILDHTVF